MSDNKFKYTIPPSMGDHIPEYFWAAFAGELVGVFGPHILDKVDDEDDSYYFIQYDTGTSGWHEAFKSACFKTECDWLYGYYQRLDWMESDQFDAEIADLVVKNCIEADHSGASPYYLYLLRGCHE